MALGDDALAAGMDIVEATDDRKLGADEITKTRDYIAQRTSAVTPVVKGGTGSTTAAAARTALGIPEWDYNVAANELVIRASDGYFSVSNAVQSVHPVNLGQLGVELAQKVGTSGNWTMGGHLYLPNSYAAVASYTIAYIDGDGRVSRGASSERYKNFISTIEPSELGDIFPELYRFQMRSPDGVGDGVWHYGFIAERLAEHPDQAVFVVYDTEGRPDSIDFIGLLLAQVSQLREREIERDIWTEQVLARLEALEARS